MIQGKNLGDAAVRAGTVKRVVFSGGERIGVDVMDNKAKIEVRIRARHFIATTPTRTSLVTRGGRLSAPCSS